MLLFEMPPPSLKIERSHFDKRARKEASCKRHSNPKILTSFWLRLISLSKQIDSHAVKDMEEEHRVLFEKHAQSLKKLRSEVQEKIDKEETPESGPYSEGMHKAIDDIVTAMKNLGSYFS